MAEDNEISEKPAPLVARYRDSCLWFLREDFIPASRREALLASNGYSVEVLRQPD